MNRPLTILPCPFCGGPASIEEVDNNGRWKFSVGCSTDGNGASDFCMGYQSLTTFSTRHEAVEAWNKRAPH